MPYGGAIPSLDLVSRHTTIEYVTGVEYSPPALLFVIDVTVAAEELEAVRGEIRLLLDTMPENTPVGLIAYGRHVSLYELGSKGMKIRSFSGDFHVTSLETRHDLKIGIQGTTRGVGNKFVVPYGMHKRVIDEALLDIATDLFLSEGREGHRPQVCTGVAMAVAINVLESTFAQLSARIVLFSGNATTTGPGSIVGLEKKIPLRMHVEIAQEKSPYLHKAIKYYEKLANQVAANGHVVDIFSSSYDQTGLFEFKDLCSNTGGIMLMTESFQSSQFINSFRKLFRIGHSPSIAKEDRVVPFFSEMAFQADMKVLCSHPIHVKNCIGAIAPNLKKMNNTGSNSAVSWGQWKLCGPNPYSTYAIVFGVKGDAKDHPPFIYTQLKTCYRHACGFLITRVTTVVHSTAPPESSETVFLSGLDQQCAAAFTAREVVFTQGENHSVSRAIDQRLIKFMKRFCHRTRNSSPPSVQVPEMINLFSQLMYYFRRGILVQIFNSSPDETIYFRHCLLKESVSNILIMMQPTLESYQLDEDPSPVLLAASSISQHNILLLDTYFTIVIHVGKVIAQWRQMGYHLNPDYSNLKELLSLPQTDAQLLIDSRLPVPLYVECDQDSSQARFLIATLDPSTSKTSTSEKLTLSEDCSLTTFQQDLFKLLSQE